MPFLDWLVVIGYLAIVAMIGFIASRRSDQGNAFFLAGRYLGISGEMDGAKPRYTRGTKLGLAPSKFLLHCPLEEKVGWRQAEFHPSFLMTFENHHLSSMFGTENHLAGNDSSTHSAGS